MVKKINENSLEFNVVKDDSKSKLKVDEGKIIWCKVTTTSIIPTRENESAGFDLYADIPLDTDHFEIKANTSKSVPTGIRTAIPEGFVGLLEERGSTGSINLKRNAGVIDSGYRGEIFVLLYNGNNKTVVLSRGLEKTVEYKDCIYYPMSKAIAQMMVVPVPKFEVVEYSTEDFNKLTTERGEGKLGSSGK